MVKRQIDCANNTNDKLSELNLKSPSFKRKVTPAFDKGDITWSEFSKQRAERKLELLELSYPAGIEDFKNAKSLYEILKNCELVYTEKDKFFRDLELSITPHFMKFVYQMDIARIIQWVLLAGPKHMRDRFMKLIMPEFINMAQKRYSCHIIQTVIKSPCDKPLKKEIINMCKGNVYNLVRHKFSAPTLEMIYSRFCNADEKTALREELYFGNKPNLQVLTSGDLKTILTNNTDLKRGILRNLKSILTKLVQKPFCYKSTIVMKVLNEYLNNCEDTDRDEMLDLLSTEVVDLIKTRSGANVAVKIIWSSTAKEKKEIVRTLKPIFNSIVKTAAGSRFLLALIDSVDDTVLIKKAFLQQLIDNVEELVKNEHAKRIVLYIFSHRDAQFFTPFYLEEIKTTDNPKFSKKSNEQRMSELKDFCIDPIITKIGDNPSLWLSEGSTCLITSAILKQGTGETVEATFLSIASYLIQSKDNLNEDNKSVNGLLEDKAIHRMMKEIIKNDKQRHESGESTFSNCLINVLTETSFLQWISSNRGCFLLIFMLETGINEVVSKMTKHLNKNKIKKAITSSTLEGAKLLLEALNKLK